MMCKQLVYQMMMMFILLFLSLCRTAALQMVKSGCQEECGGITIPYPFGIGRNKHNETCYKDKWFQIDCKWRGKPYLRSIKLEVLNISLSRNYRGRLQVYSPVAFLCNHSGHDDAADLTGSPFLYSSRYNTFTAVSCGNLVLVSSVDSTTVGGCMSVCGSDSTKMKCESGINCCQTSIPSFLTVINYNETTTSSFPVNKETSSCNTCNKFAFLADKVWFEENSISSSDISAFKSMHKQVPVTLNWMLINDTKSFAQFGVIINKHDGSGDLDRYCEFRDTPTPRVNLSEILCNCKNGFKGNPYLGPCHDIDECMDEKICGHHRNCVNAPGSYVCHGESKTKLIIATGLSSSFGLLFLLIGSWFGYRLLKKRNEIKQRKMFYKRNGGLLLEQQLSSGKVDVEKIKLFKSQELEKSTDNFNSDRILGQGGQGTVYKGMLDDGRIIAVKKSKMVDESKVSEFINEVVILSQINHRNVVKLLGCCLETEVPLLVYEFIPNGTLSKYITDQIEDFPLTWKMRLRIATEVAGALAHLHYTASIPIYHRDIKSTNILLDEKYKAKVADFGTSRSIAIDQTHLTTSLVHGTFGYLDPEYFQSGRFTEKSDVYSFGVVLVELLTGQEPISFLRSEEEGRGLATYFIMSMHKDCLFEIVDARVLKEGSKADIEVVANLARRCLDLNGRMRPTMKEVTAELDRIQKPYKISTNIPNYQLVEFVRHESVEPWSSLTEPILDACEMPLVLSFNTR